MKQANPFKDWRESYEKEIRAILAEKNMSQNTVPSTEEEPSVYPGKPEDRIADALQSPLDTLLPLPARERRPKKEPALAGVDEVEGRLFLCTEVTRADLPDVSIDRDCLFGECVGRGSDQSSMEALISDLIRYAPEDVQAAIAQAEADKRQKSDASQRPVDDLLNKQYHDQPRAESEIPGIQDAF